jgi:nicotinamide riboside transporter PnuC
VSRRREQLPLPARPYRDSLVMYVVLGGVILVVAWLTGGDLARAAAVAAGFVIVATAWSWWRFRQRIRREAPR